MLTLYFYENLFDFIQSVTVEVVCNSFVTVGVTVETLVNTGCNGCNG